MLLGYVVSEKNALADADDDECETRSAWLCVSRKLATLQTQRRPTNVETQDCG